MLLTGIAAIFFLWFLGALVAHLGSAGSSGSRLSTTALAAAVASIAPLPSDRSRPPSWPRGRPRRSAPPDDDADEHPGAGLIFAPVLRVLADTRLLAYTASWFALAPFVAAIAALSMRTGAFPRWHANFGYGVFFLGLVAGLGVFVRTGPLAPGAGVSYISFLALLAWLAATSGLLVQAIAPAPPPVQAPADTPGQPGT